MYNKAIDAPTLEEAIAIIDVSSKDNEELEDTKSKNRLEEIKTKAREEGKFDLEVAKERASQPVVPMQ